ncbi:MAG: hypothetical protein RLO04_01200 [Limnobacter sp.]|uniref:hypothetical protein n=1 Tax=Limnobacter sp. TaxID=2003368 RepID=UPI0032EC533E
MIMLLGQLLFVVVVLILMVAKVCSLLLLFVVLKVIRRYSPRGLKRNENHEKKKGQRANHCRIKPPGLRYCQSRMLRAIVFELDAG